MRGSSTACLIFRKKVTASLPSTRRWSYVNAMYIIGRMTTCWQWNILIRESLTRQLTVCIVFTCPLRAIGLSKMPCMPRMALCGGLMMGVPINEPNTPPLLIVKVPPSISSTAMAPRRAFSPKPANSISISAKFLLSTLRNTGTTRPFGVATATEMSTWSR